MKRTRKTTIHCGGLILAGWYLLVSTNMAFGLFDWIAPLTKTVTTLDFPCARHDCGCKTAEQCGASCCCFPQTTKPSSNPCHRDHHEPVGPVTVKTTYLSTANCSGQYPGDSSVGGHALDVHILAAASSVMPPETERALLFEHIESPSVLVDPPDKIPI